MSIRGKEIYIIAVVIAVVLVVAWYFLLLSPTRSDISELEAQISTQEMTLSTTQSEVARLEQFEKTAPQSRADIVRLSKMLPESEVVPSLMIDLDKTADTSGVDLLNLTKGTTVKGTPYGVQPLTVQVEGRFFDVEDFLYRLESYVAFRNSQFRATGRLIDIVTMDISPEYTDVPAGTSPPLTVDVTLNAYLWGGEAAPTAATAPASDGGVQ